jgi:hypothetical protein
MYRIYSKDLFTTEFVHSLLEMRMEFIILI